MNGSGTAWRRVVGVLWRLAALAQLSFCCMFVLVRFPPRLCGWGTALISLLLGMWLFIPRKILDRVFLLRFMRRILPAPIIGVAAVASALGMGWFYWQMPKAVYEPVDIGYAGSDFVKNQRALVIAPHQDDDVNMAGAVMKALTDGGAQVSVAFVTNGDFSDGAKVRLNEARACMKELNIPEENLYFLGYGNEWKGEHLYNRKPNQSVRSFSGYKKTYGLESHPDFATGFFGKPSLYTRGNCLRDMKNLIRFVNPNVIYCADYDRHPDHRATSLLFEEAMGQLMAEDPAFRPLVFKSISYLTAWLAYRDFFTIPMKATDCPNEPGYPLGTPSYRWEERVRFPVPNGFTSYTLEANQVVRLHRCYSSQHAEAMSGRVANSDQVFFERRTDSLLYGESLSPSSGKAELLNDFKLFDTSDIRADVFDRGIWIPTDEEKTVRCEFKSPQSVNCITLWDNPSPDDNVLSARLTLSDGTVVEIGALAPEGGSNELRFPKRDNIRWAQLQLTGTQGAGAGLTEWELSCRSQRPTQFLKLTSGDGNFLYEAPAKANTPLPLGVYAWPALPENATFRLCAENEKTGEESTQTGLFAQELTLAPLERGSWRVRVTCEQNESLSDECVFQVGRLMLKKRLVQKFEQNLLACKELFA